MYNDTNADYTNYPNIYNDVYWGNFTYENDSHEIITNRNNFIQDFNIAKCWNNRVSRKGREIAQDVNDIHLDHMEYYRTNDKKVFVITSPACSVDEDIHPIMIEAGYIEMYRLYSTRLRTYYKYLY